MRCLITCTLARRKAVCASLKMGAICSASVCATKCEQQAKLPCGSGTSGCCISGHAPNSWPFLAMARSANRLASCTFCPSTCAGTILVNYFCVDALEHTAHLACFAALSPRRGQQPKHHPLYVWHACLLGSLQDSFGLGLANSVVDRDRRAVLECAHSQSQYHLALCRLAKCCSQLESLQIMQMAVDKGQHRCTLQLQCASTHNDRVCVCTSERLGNGSS